MGQESPENYSELKRFINGYSKKLSLQSAMKETEINFDFKDFK